MRKTFEVEELKKRVNHALANTESEVNNADYRRGLMGLLETVLHDTGNYRGFRYLETPYVEGETDETRVAYY
jgi:hypothetical protein